MSKKPPTDTFTRFTSTTPSFSQSKPSSPSFNSSPPKASSQPQSSETPQERVARLRAAHAAKRASELSTTDRVLASGRRAADILHRGTTYTLLGFSFAATVVAAYGLVSLVSHNRTQKRAWIEREMDKLESARSSFLKGAASAEQLHLLEQERAGEEIRKRYEVDKKRKKEQGYFSQVKGLFSKKAAEGDMGANSEELTLAERGMKLRESEFAEEERREQTQNGRFKMGDAELEFKPAAVADSNIAGVGLDEKGRPVPKGKMERRTVSDSPILEAVQAQGRRGGQLDTLAANISGDVQNAGSSFWSSIFGGSSRS